MDDLEHPVSDSPPLEDDAMSSREAAVTLIGAVGRAGPPWSFLASGVLHGRDLQSEGTKAWPIVLPDGEMLGVIVREAGESSDDELVTVLLRTLVALVAAECDAAEAEKRADAAELEARVDALTGLVNRRAWDNALVAETARMRRNGSTAVIVIVDIDMLKETNDTEGHLAGDLLIRRTADGLRDAVRDEDIVARIGGDEFGILAVESAGDPTGLLKRVDKVLRDIEVDASLGAAVGRSGEALSAAVARADLGMYAAKRRRKAARLSGAAGS